jgi:hypothetical protein
MDVSLDPVPRKGLLSENVSSLPSVQRSYISDNEASGKEEGNLDFSSYQGCSSYDDCGIVVMYSVVNCKTEGVQRDTVVLGCKV